MEWSFWCIIMFSPNNWTREGGREKGIDGKKGKREKVKEVHVHILWTMKGIEGREIYGGREKWRDR